ncbi:FUSC family protein [Anaerofustis butyriciformans]|uniref:FUSC family protein n=1 Tax=Anaerofustis butyriciformans TaxID=3108533 RepID=UPI002E37F23C|nr:FUSC family protein [Anaerofustis sp. HA2171]
MKFYDILQWDPQVTKTLMSKKTSKKEKIKLGIGMFMRSILIVLFAIAFISGLTSIFGSKNTPMAVAIFCILLGVRFVDFGYIIRDSLVTLFFVFFLLLVSPVIANIAFPLLGFIIHFISFFAILFITCDKPETGNGGLFSFAYIYLSGNPVYGQDFIYRIYLTITGFFICGLIFYVKHRDKNTDISFFEKIKQMDMKEFKYQWMFRMSMGVSAILSLGLAFNIERFMWDGFACGSLLSEYSKQSKIKERFMQRFIGVIAGSVLFYFVYCLLPMELHSMIGPFGGFCLGFCVDYKYKTALNCFGALMIASQIYGLQSAILLRIADTIIGIIFAFLFYYIYERYIYEKVSSIRWRSLNITE